MRVKLTSRDSWLSAKVTIAAGAQTEISERNLVSEQMKTVRRAAGRSSIFQTDGCENLISNSQQSHYYIRNLSLIDSATLQGPLWMIVIGYFAALKCFSCFCEQRVEMPAVG